MFKEIDLLERLKKDDATALHELFTFYYRPLTAYARSIVIDAETAKDIIQDVFAGIWENRSSLAVNSSLKAFLFTCVHNTSIDHLRRQKRLSDLERKLLEKMAEKEVHQNEESGILNSMILNETSELINSAIESLPDQCRKIFTMSRFQGLKHKEIAEKLNISPKTVEAHIYTALKSIREKIKNK